MNRMIVPGPGGRGKYPGPPDPAQWATAPAAAKNYPLKKAPESVR
jgi:hypothetical protein